MVVRLSGELTSRQREVLAVLEEALLADPLEPHVIVATVACKKVTTMSRSDRIDITVGIVDLEVLPIGTDGYNSARTLMDEGRQRRTGEVPLPTMEL